MAPAGQTEDVTQGVVAEGALGAAKDGGMKKVLIAARFIFQRRNSLQTHAYRPQKLPLGDT